ncbi:hypothetical protein OCAR_5658 [Afipia carboxidovorans OM5]|nr:hypothetical protein OCAR_5658 [Afipia carboxidovorans OM5]
MVRLRTAGDRLSPPTDLRKQLSPPPLNVMRGLDPRIHQQDGLPGQARQ